MDLQVTDNRAQSRFEIRADGELAGFAEYSMSGNEIAFTHTTTEDRFRGHGLAGRLVQSAELDHRAPRICRPGPGRPPFAVWPVTTASGDHSTAVIPAERGPP
jgi:predicted GNAT family acetyltransferase